MLVDSHCHLNLLNLDAYAGDLNALLQRAEQRGITRILCVGVDLDHAHEVIRVAQQFAAVVASVGLHPSEKVAREPTVEELVTLAQQPKVVAIGETGLDYYYNKTGWDTMAERFRRHIRAAIILNKPIIVHSRSAEQDTLRILREEKAEQVSGVMHCFTESWEMAEAAMALGFYISFSGIVTFKNATAIAEVAKKVPLERLLIETDAPYLAPHPYRGKPNEPHYLRDIAEHMTHLKNTTLATFADVTTQNFLRLFKC
ncbi:MAG: deoxyribonuclease [Coxiella sp. RIFCSPHIGHO2_12_FULL_44_14]|nr:MAG: deoxyribonuclease [Coxiella sp. RIFCSPHIGHO2_12_FULL_44_14]